METPLGRKMKPRKVGIMVDTGFRAPKGAQYRRTGTNVDGCYERDEDQGPELWVPSVLCSHDMSWVGTTMTPDSEGPFKDDQLYFSVNDVEVSQLQPFG
jgi:hypothetical protein